MSIRRPFASLTLFAVAITSNMPSADAGDCCSWLFGGCRTAPAPAYPVGQPVPVGNAAAVGYGANMPVTGMPVTGMPVTGYPVSGYAANYGNYYGSMMPVVGPSGYGYPAGQVNGVAAATAPSIMSYVPDYRASQYRAPVTYYRPMMTTDPNTGGQVVALAPCTSYEYQTQRVPTFGYNGVMGSFSTPPVVPAPPTMPTYTLPSGGVPLATGGPAAVLPPTSGAAAMGYGSYPSASPLSSTAPATSSNFGSSPYSSYSPQQPALTAPPSGSYPTQPLSSTPGYYGSVTGGTTGGSAGSFASPSYTPNIVAPPANTYPANSYPGSPNHPQTFPMTPAPGSTLYRDPAGDAAPVLPPVNTGASLERPQLRAIVRQPVTANNSLNSEKDSQAETRQSPAPTMDPIPVPADFDQQPRWNPGLLSDQDRTALRPIAPKSNSYDSSGYAGQSKPIQWASFQSENQPEPARQPTGLRAIAPSQAPSKASTQPAVQNQSAQPTTAPRPARQYSTDGWKVSK